MKLEMARRVATQQLPSSDYLGMKWADGGIYRASNGEYMTCSDVHRSLHWEAAGLGRRWTWQGFVNAYGADASITLTKTKGGSNAS